MDDGVTYRQIVRQIAYDHRGFVTTAQASAAGVPAVELPKLAARGGLQNIAYGIYRVPDIPTDDLDPYAEALLRAGAGSYLHGESVLALFGLADVNPRRIRVAVRRRTRTSMPPSIEITWVRAEARTVRYEGLDSQPVAEALMECRGQIETDRLISAAREARATGLLTTTEWRLVSKELRR